ncbi:MAG: hypothetical protein ABS955_10850, partial [Stenotrophomonas maltophilia]
MMQDQPGTDHRPDRLPDPHRTCIASFLPSAGGWGDAVRRAIDAGPACRLPFPGDPCMTLSDLRPARRALPVALALACASIALPA